MADDLDSFFAKKKAKQATRKKKAGVQDVDVLARKLERMVKEQEETDRIEEEKLRLNNPDQKEQKEEDSEWIQPPEHEDVNIEELNLKELEVDEFMHEEKTEQTEVSEPKKTWNTAATEDGRGETGPAATEQPPAEAKEAVKEAPPQPTKYVPPSLRAGSGGGSRTGPTTRVGPMPNIGDAIHFPSLADAAKIDTDADKKRNRFLPHQMLGA